MSRSPQPWLTVAIAGSLFAVIGLVVVALADGDPKTVGVGAGLAALGLLAAPAEVLYDSIVAALGRNCSA